jgi:L-fuculose-phosphate aldolase
MELEDIVQIRDGKIEAGKMASRSVLLHQQIFKMHPGINVIIITQSPGIMAFGVTDTDYDVRTIPESWIFLQDVPKVPFGSQFAGKNSIPELLSRKIPAIIIENDSILVTGQAVLQTFDRLEVAEFSARSLIMAAPMGKLLPINDQQVEELRKKFLK